MLLGFKSRFVPFVEDGSKTHTIRAKRKIRPRVGETCHCYTGLRTKACRLLGRWECVKVEPIRIEVVTAHQDVTYKLQITIAGVLLSDDEANALARRDGFRPPPATRSRPLQWMGEFWVWEHGLYFGGPVFEGDLIHWKYSRTSGGDNAA